MLVDSSWYPSHAMLLAAMALFATGIIALRQGPDLTPGMQRLLKYVFVISCVATVSMAVHLFAALGAESLAGEAVARAPGADRQRNRRRPGVDLALASLAVVGGLTRSVGNRITIPFGLVGGLAFALESGTIAYTDTLDSLFKIGSLLSIWADPGRRDGDPATRLNPTGSPRQPATTAMLAAPPAHRSLLSARPLRRSLILSY